jgi:hypothetical protein
METLGYQQSMPYRGMRSLGGVTACRSLLTNLKLGTMHVENVLFYTRLATGGLGPLDRGLEEPSVGMVLGWDLLRRLEMVRFDFAEKKVSFVSTERMDIDDTALSGRATISSVPGYGCVVEGRLGGQPQLFVLDPAGDFELAFAGTALEGVDELSLGSLTVRNVAVSTVAMEGQLPRIGGRLLSKYAVTLCPRQGLVYFEAELVLK